MVVSLIISALVIGSVYGLIALGYSLIYSASGLMTFTQGELLMLGAYLGLTFYKFLGFPFIVALILTLIIMFVFGLMIERFLIRVLLNKKASPIYVVPVSYTHLDVYKRQVYNLLNKTKITKI